MRKYRHYLALLIFLFRCSSVQGHDDGHAASDHANSSNQRGDNPYFAAYKPNYIIGSANGGENSSCDIKFQLSIKQRLAPRLKGADATEDKEEGWLRRFHFGYTQRSFWDICRDSAPFRDSVFSPELFHRTEFKISRGPDKPNNRGRMQVGVKHASNGKDGSDSRSWNRLYVEAEYLHGFNLWDSIFGVESEHGFKEGTTPKISLGLVAWYIIDTGDENNDIEDYLGYSKLNFKLSTKSEQLALSSWVGKRGKVSVESNLIFKSWPILNIIPVVGDILPSKDNTYFWHVQYFNGYGDELLRYNTREKVARLGLLFTY